MGEHTRVATKASEIKKENSASQTRKPERSQSMDSPVDRILFLQQTVGNQVVQRMMKSGTFQAKLRIGQPNDVYEQEADRVADQIIRMPEPKVQRQSEEKEEEEPVQLKPLADQITPLQRQVEEEEEEPIQARLKDNVQVQRQEKEEKIHLKSIVSAVPEITPEMERDIQSVKGGGQPLPRSERAFFEPRFGADFSKVRMHSNARAANVARSVNARAFTLGRNVVFGAGQYSPGTPSGRKLLAHELTHVIQQNSGPDVRQKRALSSLLRSQTAPLMRGTGPWLERPGLGITAKATNEIPSGRRVITRLQHQSGNQRVCQPSGNHGLRNRIFRQPQGRRRQRRRRQAGFRIEMHVVGDRGLMVAGATFHPTLRAFRNFMLHQNRRLRRLRRGWWTLWFAIHGWDGVVAYSTRCTQGVNCFNARAFRAVFSGARWRGWKRRSGPSRVVLYSCNLTAAMTATIENALKRPGTVRTQSPRSRHCNITYRPRSVLIGGTNITTRRQYRRLGRQDRQTFWRLLLTFRPLGYGHIPPARLRAVRQMMRLYFDAPPVGRWMEATVTFTGVGARPGWVIPLYRYTRGSRYALDCQRPAPLPRYRPGRVRILGRGRP